MYFFSNFVKGNLHTVVWDTDSVIDTMIPSAEYTNYHRGYFPPSLSTKVLTACDIN